MFLFKLISKIHIKNAVSDCFRVLKILAPKSPDNLLVWGYMTESGSCAIPAL